MSIIHFLDGPSGAQSAEGVKTILRRHLVGVDKPLTSEELWQRVEVRAVNARTLIGRCAIATVIPLLIKQLSCTYTV